MAKSLLIEAEDDKYAHIGYGKYKEKGKEDDEDAEVYKKTDSGKFVKSSDQSDDGKDKDKEPDEPKGTKLGKGDFDRDSNKAGDDDADDMDRDADDGEFADDTNLWDPNGPEDRDQIMKALLKDPEISAKLGDKPYWDDVDVVADDDEGETAVTLKPNMTLGDMKKQILGKEDADDEPKGKPKSRYKVENKPDFKKTGTFDDGNKKAKSLIRKKLKTLGIKPDKSTSTSVHGFRRTTQKGYVLKSHKKYGEAYKMKIWVDDMYKDKVPEMVDHMREQGFDVRDSSNQSFTINHDDWRVGKFV
jgi:hypothetical protein